MKHEPNGDAAARVKSGANLNGVELDVRAAALYDNWVVIRSTKPRSGLDVSLDGALNFHVVLRSSVTLHLAEILAKLKPESLQ